MGKAMELPGMSPLGAEEITWRVRETAGVDIHAKGFLPEEAAPGIFPHLENHPSKVSV